MENELIKINLDNSDRPTVNGRELHEFLDKCNSFEDFFIIVSKIKVSVNKEDLKCLMNEVKKFIFKYKSEAITYLVDSILTEKVLPCNNPISEHNTERDMQDFIINNFKKIFPQYKFCGSEVVVDNIGRIDILGEYFGRPVIIEIKKTHHNPNKQLIAYSSVYENPILIAITETPIGNKAIDKIHYFTFDEIIMKAKT